MRTDYFGDLLPEFVTSVTIKKPELATPEYRVNSNDNNELVKVLPVLPVLPRKTHNGEKKTEEHPRRYSYRYRLHNGEGGGIFITDAATLEGARNELDAAYGDRLAVVTPA